jgi:hypothetical protein
VGESVEPKLGLEIGTTLGIAVGKGVMFALGLAVGTALGVAVGKGAGFALGPAVGAALGIAVGKGVGLALGLAVGATLGIAVGFTLTLGLELGSAVGISVGPELGLLVGATANDNFLMTLLLVSPIYKDFWSVESAKADGAANAKVKTFVALRGTAAAAKVVTSPTNHNITNRRAKETKIDLLQR